MRNIYRLALNTGLVISFAGVVWAQTSSVSVPNATSESQRNTVAIQDDVLLPLIDEPEHHFKMASRYFARGDDSRSAAEIRAGAAFLKLEAGRHDATDKAELEDEAEHLDDLAVEVAKGSVKSPKELNNAFASADLALARHYHQMPWRRLSKMSIRRLATGSTAQPTHWWAQHDGRDTNLHKPARQL